MAKTTIEQLKDAINGVLGAMSTVHGPVRSAVTTKLKAVLVLVDKMGGTDVAKAADALKAKDEAVEIAALQTEKFNAAKARIAELEASIREMAGVIDKQVKDLIEKDAALKEASDATLAMKAQIEKQNAPSDLHRTANDDPSADTTPHQAPG